jgi:lipopolysaccharide export system protein LptA
MRLVFAALAVLLLAVHPAAAQDEPVEVTADTFTIDEANSQAVFSGSVVIVSGTLRVWADKVVVEYGAGGQSDIESFLATGRVRIRTPEQEATGGRAVYTPASQLLRLTENVTVTSDAGTVTGPELVVDLATNNTVFKGGEGGRVTGVFTPQ